MSKISNYIPLLSHLFAHQSDKNNEGLLCSRIAIVFITVVGLSIAERRTTLPSQINVPEILFLGAAIVFVDILLTFRKSQIPSQLRHPSHIPGSSSSSSMTITSTSTCQLSQDPYLQELPLIQSYSWEHNDPQATFIQLQQIQMDNADRFSYVPTNPTIDSFSNVRTIVPTRVSIHPNAPPDAYGFNGNHVCLIIGQPFIATQSPNYADRSGVKEAAFFAAILHNRVCAVINLMPPTEHLRYEMTPYVATTPGTHRVIEDNRLNRRYHLKCEETVTPPNQFYQSSRHTLSIVEESTASQEIFYANINHWPDYGVISTKCLHSLVNEIALVRETCGDANILVHCRGGVGRTGTLMVACALYTCLLQGKLNKDNLGITIAALVWSARLQRGAGKDANTVQTQEQMKLLFDYANELLAGRL